MVIKYMAVVVINYLSINTLCVTGDTFGSSILFYNGASPSTYSQYDLGSAESVLQNLKFDWQKKIALFIHGWEQSPTKPTVQTLIKAYITNGRYNILVLDWSQAAASPNYVEVSSKVDELGREVALFLGRMNTEGVSYSNIHLVGHSLGAYVASSAGKYTVAAGSILARITGLDPGNAYVNPLTRDDAEFVDIIHTAAGVMGTIVFNSGTVDFLPNNGGPLQPGCSIIPIIISILPSILSLSLKPTQQKIACSHLRAIDLWSESVQYKDDVRFLSTNALNSEKQIQMGNNCPTDATGQYTLKTNGASPYSKQNSRKRII